MPEPFPGHYVFAIPLRPAFDAAAALVLSTDSFTLYDLPTALAPSFEARPLTESLFDLLF